MSVDKLGRGEYMSDSIKNWILVIRTPEEKKYMRPLFIFVLKLFVEIFGENTMAAEFCVLYNDASSECPMLIRNTVPIHIRTRAENLGYWAQFIYQLSHEMTHYVIRQYKTDKAAIVKWFEETICEAMSLTPSICPVNRRPPNSGLVFQYFSNN